MEQQAEKRNDEFRWHSRYELYEFFKINFNLVKKDVDKEIRAVMATFKPRRFRVIRTTELWQKVGLTLEQKYPLQLPLDNEE
jgi:hypothetical protein